MIGRRLGSGLGLSAARPTKTEGMLVSETTMTEGTLVSEMGVSVVRSHGEGGMLVSEIGVSVSNSTITGRRFGSELGLLVNRSVRNGGILDGEAAFSVVIILGPAVSGRGNPRTRNDMCVAESLIWSIIIPVC